MAEDRQICGTCDGEPGLPSVAIATLGTLGSTQGSNPRRSRAAFPGFVEAGVDAFLS